MLRGEGGGACERVRGAHLGGFEDLVLLWTLLKEQLVLAVSGPS